MTILFGVIALLVLFVALWLVLSARDLDCRLKSLLADEVDRVQDIERSLERLRVESQQIVQR
ncbi:MAG TPA: hypothetical protein VFS47_16465 [Steroidobacteraceae bacterium]|nr:hypothetical protein [Steroidobacteraceae bacterium]